MENNQNLHSTYLPAFFFFFFEKDLPAKLGQVKLIFSSKLLVITKIIMGFE